MIAGVPAPRPLVRRSIAGDEQDALASRHQQLLFELPNVVQRRLAGMGDVAGDFFRPQLVLIAIAVVHRQTVEAGQQWQAVDFKRPDHRIEVVADLGFCQRPGHRLGFVARCEHAGFHEVADFGNDAGFLLAQQFIALLGRVAAHHGGRFAGRVVARAQRGPFGRALDFVVEFHGGPRCSVRLSLLFSAPGTSRTAAP